MTAAPVAAPTEHDGLREAPDLGRVERLASRRHLRPAASGKGAVALIIAASIVWMILNAQAILTLVLGLCVALVADGVLALRGLRLDRVELHPVGDAVAGESTRWHLHVPGVRRPVSFRPVRYPPGEEVLVARDHPGVITLPPTPRGVIHYAVFDAVATGPVGLWRALRRIRTVPHEPVIVGPRALPVATRWPSPVVVGFGATESSPRGDDLFRGVRPYIRGDELRKIHWKATARHQELMVREADGTGVVALQITVDLTPPWSVVEHIIANATWLAEGAVRQGWTVQLVTLDQTPPPPRMAGLGRPLGPPPIMLAVPMPPPSVLAQRVAGVAQIRRQLATATPGTPIAPPWAGLRCRVNARGVDWS